MEENKEKKGSVKAFLYLFLAKITAVSNVVLFIFMVGMALVLGAHILLRFVFNFPLSWSNTISRYAYIYIVLLGTAVSYIEGQHAKIEILYDIVPKRYKLIFDFFHIAVMIFVCIVLGVMGIKHSITMWPVSPPIIPWLPLGSVYLSVPISAFIMIVFLIQKMFALKDDIKV